MDSRIALTPILAAMLAASPCLARDIARAPNPGAGVPCPEYGTGFVRLPGNATCIRVSGRVAAGAELHTHRGGTIAAPAIDGRLAIDTRTGSDLGPVRTFVRIGSRRR